MNKIGTIFEVRSKVKNNHTKEYYCTVMNPSPSFSKAKSNKKTRLNYRISYPSRSDNYVFMTKKQQHRDDYRLQYKISCIRGRRMCKKNYLVFRVVKNLCYLEGDWFNVLLEVVRIRILCLHTTKT